jgi:hypothetical protein
MIVEQCVERICPEQMITRLYVVREDRSLACNKT